MPAIPRLVLWTLSLAVAASSGLLPWARAATATVTASKDNTLYGNSNLSNGAGRYLFIGSSGANGGGRVLRSLVAFNLAGQVPAGSTVTAVTLTLTIDTPLTANTNTLRMHRLLADWGEGTSRAGMGEGGGTAATAGDATWTARIFNTADWSTPGGDFSPNPSATLPVAGRPGSAVLTGAGLVADVQAWVNNPATNFGWLLAAQDESGAAVRFSSRQGPAAPTLVVEYTTGSGGGAPSAPTITVQPASQTVATGGSATFRVQATGTAPLAYQWRKDGTPIPGAAGAVLTIGNVSAPTAGVYTVVVSNAAGSVTSAGATLTLESAPPLSGGPITARLSNLSVRASMAAAQTLIVGFSVSGGSRSLLVRGVGPTLGSFGVPGVMADPRLQVFAGNTLAAQNDNWGSSPALSAAFTAVGAFPLVAGSADAALLQAAEGTGSVHLTGTGAGVALVELYDTGSGLSPRLVNVSTRNRVGTGDDVLIFGFFVEGTGSKNVLIRAVGPTLGSLGVPGVLANPRFEVYQAGASAAVANNDDWNASLASTFGAVGAFPLMAGSRDAALVVALSANRSYTVQVSGADGGTGEALVEIYEVP